MGQPPDDGQPEPAAQDLAGLFVLDPDELAEQAAHFLRGHADPGVGHPDPDPARLAGDRQGDAAVVAVVLHGVGQQIVEDDLDLAAVGSHDDGADRLEHQLDPARRGGRLHRFQAEAGDRHQVLFGQLALLLSRFDPGQVQQIEDQFAHALEAQQRPVDDLGELLRLHAGRQVLEEA